METVIIIDNEKRIFSNLPIAVYWLENNFKLEGFKTVLKTREYETVDGRKIIVKPARFNELFPNLYDDEGHIIKEQA